MIKIALIKEELINYCIEKNLSIYQLIFGIKLWVFIFCVHISYILQILWVFFCILYFIIKFFVLLICCHKQYYIFLKKDTFFLEKIAYDKFKSVN